MDSWRISEIVVAVGSLGGAVVSIALGAAAGLVARKVDLTGLYGVCVGCVVLGATEIAGVALQAIVMTVEGPLSMTASLGYAYAVMYGVQYAGNAVGTLLVGGGALLAVVQARAPAASE